MTSPYKYRIVGDTLIGKKTLGWSNRNDGLWIHRWNKPGQIKNARYEEIDVNDESEEESVE
jgi:hypothetical protein